MANKGKTSASQARSTVYALPYGFMTSQNNYYAEMENLPIVKMQPSDRLSYFPAGMKLSVQFEANRINEFLGLAWARIGQKVDVAGIQASEITLRFPAKYVPPANAVTKSFFPFRSSSEAGLITTRRSGF